VTGQPRIAGAGPYCSKSAPRVPILSDPLIMATDHGLLITDHVTVITVTATVNVTVIFDVFLRL
jgi:hypothetical protein